MGVIHDLSTNTSSGFDDIVARYGELRRLEIAGKLSPASRVELQNIRHQLHFDD
jgi:hypothetical protein